MIFEMRTYLLKPGTVPAVEEAFAKALPGRLKLSPLAGFWHTEVGTLNQWVHVWAYKNMADREQRRALAMKPGVWPPPRPEGVVMQRMENKFAVPASFSPLR